MPLTKFAEIGSADWAAITPVDASFAYHSASNSGNSIVACSNKKTEQGLCTYCQKQDGNRTKGWEGVFLCEACKSKYPDCCCCDKKVCSGNHEESLNICQTCKSMGLVSNESDVINILEDILTMYKIFSINFTPNLFLDYFWCNGKSIPAASELTPLKMIQIHLVDFQHFTHNDKSHATEYQYGRCECRGAIVRHPTTDGGVHVEDRRWVDCVQIVRGLPRVMFGSLLAHELLHAYLWLHGFGTIDAFVEEGLCNCMSAFYLRRVLARTKKFYSMPNVLPVHGVERSMCEYMLLKMERSNHPHYGIGFRSAKAAVEMLGWRHVLAFVKSEGRLPNASDIAKPRRHMHRRPHH